MCLWQDRLRWQPGMPQHMIGGLMWDSSNQHGYNYMCVVFDQVAIPQHRDKMTNQNIVDIDFGPMYSRVQAPAGCLGFGDGDLAHKMRVLTHAARLRTGSEEGFRAWRWAQVGSCTDQGGADKLIADAPCIADDDSVFEVAQSLQEAGTRVPPTDADKFLFPRMIHCTGPLHIVWNAYKTAVIECPGWSRFEDIVRASCAFLGTPGTRSRCLAKCVPDPAEQALFLNWKHHVVDWKWGYMEELLRQFSRAAPVFFDRLPHRILDGVDAAEPEGPEAGEAGIFDKHKHMPVLSLIEFTWKARIARNVFCRKVACAEIMLSIVY